MTIEREKKVCTICKGLGKIKHWDTGNLVTCPECNGKGYTF